MAPDLSAIIVSAGVTAVVGAVSLAARAYLGRWLASSR